MQSFIIFFYIFSLVVYGNSFEWSKGDVYPKDSNLSTFIHQEIQKYSYKEPLKVTKAIPPLVKKPFFPPEVEVPQLPKPIKLIRGEFEKTVEFEKRVQEAVKKRKALLKKMQMEYRKKVEIRNKEIERLTKEYNQAVEKRNKILKNLQYIKEKDNQRLQLHHQAKVEEAYLHIDKFAKKAIEHLYGKPLLSYESYNADQEKIYLKVHSLAKGKFQKKIVVTMKPKIAKNFKYALIQTTPKVVFDVEVDQHKQIKLFVNSITFYYKKQLYVAEDVFQEYIAKPVEITVASQKIDPIKSGDIAQLALQQNQELHLQNPNLNDKVIFSNVMYDESGAIIGANKLVNQAKKLKAQKLDKHKWLFMISIEQYAQTDNVMYATRSTQALKILMQKRLGIDTEHTTTLFNSQATSGAIKDALHALFAKVEEKDIIYFYYSGHGVPGSDADAYILPQDKVVDFIDKDPFFKLENIYKELALSKAKHSFVFIDACFSGKTDNKLLFKGVAPGLIRTKKTQLYNADKLTVVTAGTDKEFSNMYEQERYRLFSYYLAEALLEDKNDIEILYKYLVANVVEKSKKKGERYKQTPQLYGNSKMRLY